MGEDPEPTGGGKAELESLRVEVDRLTAETTRLQSELAAHPTSANRHHRRGFTAALSGLCCVMIFLSAITVWAHHTVVNTNGFVSAVSPVIDQPAVTQAIGVELTNQIFSAIDISTDVEQALPPKGQFLAVPLANAAQTFVQSQIVNVLRSPQFRSLWTTALRSTHQQVIAAVRGQNTTLRVSNGAVVLNVLPLIDVALEQVQSSASGLLGRGVTIPKLTNGELPAQVRTTLSDALGVQLPADFGQIEIAKASTLQVASDAVQLLDVLFWLVPLLTVVLIGATLWLSTTRRRTMLQILIGTVVALIVERRAVSWAQRRAVAAINPQNRTAGSDVLHQLVSGLASLTGWLIFLAVLLVALELVTGPYRWAQTLRAHSTRVSRDLSRAIGSQNTSDHAAVAWIEQNHRMLQAGGAVVGGLLLLLVPGWWFFLILVLLTGYELALWRLGTGHPHLP